jgi:hypothetical protein
MANGYKRFRSSGLNYDPKLHLRSKLDPLDLYVRHCSPAVNKVLAAILPTLEPTRAAPVLRRFPNYDEIWAQALSIRALVAFTRGIAESLESRALWG